MLTPWASGLLSDDARSFVAADITADFGKKFALSL
jgi:hypothetical protein